jgi:Bifunctional DNA primase/polymerase, N-terminal
MSDTISELRLALRAAGHAPVPACGKAIYLQEWSTKGAASAEEVASWSVDHPDWSNTGVLCSRTPTLDIDLSYPEAAEATADMVREWFDGRGTILTRTGQAPKRAVPFRTEQPFSKIRIEFVKPEGSKETDKPPAIEMLAHGQQFIVDGIHPDTRRPYSWHAERTLLNTPRHDLPEINEAEARSLVDLAAEMLVEKFGFQVDHGNANGADMFAGSTNGRANGKTDAVYDSDGRLDVEATLAAMQPSGASVNEIQPKVILSLLQRATPPTEVIDTVVDATMDMAKRNGLPWTREVEVKCVNARVDCDLKKLQGEYDYRTGEIPRWLAEEFHEKWADVLARGGRPHLSRQRRNGHLFSVWTYGLDKEEEGEKKNRQGPPPPGGTEGGQAKEGRRVRFKLTEWCDLRLDNELPYLVDEFLPSKGIVVVWGPPKCLKSFLMYSAMFHVAMGWDVRRQRFWDRRRPNLRESLAHPV